MNQLKLFEIVRNCFVGVERTKQSRLRRNHFPLAEQNRGNRARLSKQERNADSGENLSGECRV